MRPHFSDESGTTAARSSLGLLRSFQWIAAANLGRQLLFLLVNLLLLERLSRSMFGAFTLGFAYMQVFAGVGEFGLRQVGWREIARHPRLTSALTGLFAAARATTGLVALAIYLALLPVIWPSGNDPTIYLVFGLGILLNGTTLDFPLLGLGRADVLARLSLVAFPIYLAGCFLAVLGDEQAFLAPGFFVLSAAALLLLELSWVARNHGAIRARITWGRLRRLVAASWSLALGESLNRAYLAYPAVLIVFSLDSEAVGNYRVPELLYSLLAQFGHLLGTAGFSRLSQSFHYSPSQARSVMLAMLRSTGVFLVVPGVLAMAAVGPLLHWWIDDLPSTTTATCLLLALALSFAIPARLLRSTMASIERESWLAPVNGAALILGVGAGLWAMRRWGLPGMGFGVLSGELLAFLLLLFASWSGTGTRPEDAAPDLRRTAGA